MSLVYRIRKAKEEDRPFIASSFSQSLRNGGDFEWAFGDGGASGQFHAEVDRRLAVIMSCALIAETDDGLLGWAAGEQEWLHYVYVKQPYRCVGIGAALVQALGDQRMATHWTRGAALRKRKKQYIYWPSYWRERK